MNSKLAVQLFTLREACKEDFPGVLRKLSDMGWAGVQLAGFHDYDPKHIREVMRQVGLKAAGLHTNYNEFINEAEKLTQQAELLDTPDIIVSSIAPDYRTVEGYREVKLRMNEIASRLKKRGIRISFHNHAYEFETTVEGQSALSYLLDPAPDNHIMAEIDVYWIKKAGFEVQSFIEPYANRMPIIHLKDMTDDDEQFYAEIGTGSIDFPPILRWGEKSGVEWYVVEQDKCKTDPLECVQTSYNNLQRIIADITS